MSTRRIFTLDDDSERVEAFRARFADSFWIHSWNFYEAVALISAWPRFDEWHLDHDLGTRGVLGPGATNIGRNRATWPEYAPTWEMTGADFCTWAASCVVAKRPERVVIHSWNADGRANMARILRDAEWRNVLEVPFSARKFRAMEER